MMELKSKTPPPQLLRFLELPWLLVLAVRPRSVWVPLPHEAWLFGIPQIPKHMHLYDKSLHYTK